MRESEANVLCKPVLQDMSMDRTWHPILIRFGENTLKSCKQRSEIDPQLARHDIFCVGLWGRVGPPRRRCKRNLCNGKACAEAARTVFDEVTRHWRATDSGGRVLYRYAAGRAEALAWRVVGACHGRPLSAFSPPPFATGNST